jgi:hypothetical protein
MPKKKDENETAFHGLQEILRRDAERDGIELPPEPPEQKNPAKVAAGRKGGLKGGKARAATLTPRKRAQIAKKAANSRWSEKSRLKG